ncbi:NADPH:quinone oxidoreductase family protein, partial [Escherichia coli]|uniref:hypothetical protein n=1 Tax=Escherichia coli TaxID=562 RepID=UPI002753BCED|nr:NADPH:quinone oxidoreductase family protein [Escherichia coli]
MVVDPVGGHYSEAALRSAAEHSRYLVLGFTAGIPRLPMNLPLLKSSEIIGVNWRTFLLTEPEANDRNMRALFALY